MILAWSGNISNIPYGWHLCDGSNGTPDLRGRFVLGDSPSHPLGQTGGEEQHTLTIAEMPSHNHSVFYYQSSGNVTNGGGGVVDEPNDEGLQVDRDIFTAPQGGSQPHNNMPPYYSLAYIMRIK